MSAKKALLTFLLLAGCYAAMGKPVETKYYFFLFAYDDGQGSPNHTHTWVAYFKMNGTTVVANQAISWLPRSGVISPIELGPERGVNKAFDATIADAANLGYRLRQWGPYEVTAELWDLMEKRRESLLKDYWYRILDTANRIYKVIEPENHPAPPAVMCIHAVSDAVLPVDPKGWLMTGRSSGIKATAMVAWHLSDWYVRDASDPHVFGTVDEAVEKVMSAKLALEKFPQLQKVALKRVNNNYCNSRDNCGGLMSFLDVNGSSN